MFTEQRTNENVLLPCFSGADNLGKATLVDVRTAYQYLGIDGLTKATIAVTRVIATNNT